MTSFDLQAERERAAARRQEATIDRMARETLRAVGREAGLAEAQAHITGTWPKSADLHELVLARVGTMREEDETHQRRYTPQEVEMARDRERINEALRRLLSEDRGLTNQELRAEIVRLGFAPTASFTSWARDVRKAMGIDGRTEIAKKRAAARRDARVGTAGARQPSEEATTPGVEPDAPAPPPAVPDAEVETTTTHAGDDANTVQGVVVHVTGDPDAEARRDVQHAIVGRTERARPYRTGEAFAITDRQSGQARLVTITMPPEPTNAQWAIIERYAGLIAA